MWSMVNRRCRRLELSYLFPFRPFPLEKMDAPKLKDVKDDSNWRSDFKGKVDAQKRSRSTGP